MPCSETSPANDVNMLSDGNTSQNIRNCRMGELPFVPGVTPKVSGYGRMHAASIRPTAISVSQATNRPESAIRARRDRACSSTRATHTNATAHARAMP